MALLNIVPFDLNRRPGRPNKIGSQKGTPKTTATDAVSKTPEHRPTVNEGDHGDRRRVERRHSYKPMTKDRRAGLRRNLDANQSINKAVVLKAEKYRIDVKV